MNISLVLTTNWEMSKIHLDMLLLIKYFTVVPLTIPNHEKVGSKCMYLINQAQPYGLGFVQATLYNHLRTILI